tara:strand:+ start:2434 stop:2952 length:519 start_codon:yes stop_codon:yes gene_type:complete
MNQKAGIICSCKINNIEYFLCVMNKYTSKWGFPKGNLENDESIIDCAIREFREETGILLNLSGNENPIKLNNQNTQYYTFNSDVLIEPKSFDSQEISQIKWFSVINLLGSDHRILNSDLKYYVKNNLTNYLDKDFKVVVKKQKPKRRSTVCQNFINEGNCRFGENCKFYHFK